MGVLCKKEKVTGCLPVGAILTIAAAGSEMSNSSVITNEDGWLKRGLSSDYGRCRFAIMNPEADYDTSSLSDSKRLYGYHFTHHGTLFHKGKQHGYH